MYCTSSNYTSVGNNTSIATLLVFRESSPSVTNGYSVGTLHTMPDEEYQMGRSEVLKFNIPKSNSNPLLFGEKRP